MINKAIFYFELLREGSQSFICICEPAPSMHVEICETLPIIQPGLYTPRGGNNCNKAELKY